MSSAASEYNRTHDHIINEEVDDILLEHCSLFVRTATQVFKDDLSREVRRIGGANGQDFVAYAYNSVYGSREGQERRKARIRETAFGIKAKLEMLEQEILRERYDSFRKFANDWVNYVRNNPITPWSPQNPQAAEPPGCLVGLDGVAVARNNLTPGPTNIPAFEQQCSQVGQRFREISQHVPQNATPHRPTRSSHTLPPLRTTPRRRRRREMFQDTRYH
ncbi:hypothetical protein V8F20_012358 [Naviculisporaceae sp. PSN 640]